MYMNTVLHASVQAITSCSSSSSSHSGSPKANLSVKQSQGKGVKNSYLDPVIIRVQDEGNILHPPISEALLPVYTLLLESFAGRV